MTQKALLLFLILAVGGLLAAASAAGPSAGNRLLWQIGARDGGDGEFALAPGGYERFTDDGFFIVGESDTRRDWPYVQPGPDDAWALSKPHTFIILFGLKSVSVGGDVELQLDLLDTHSQHPPKLRLEVNGRAFEQSVGAGGGDDSLHGLSGKAKASRLSLPFPAKLLRAGDNEIRITTVGGSWLIYDWLGLNVPAGAKLARVRTHTAIDDVLPVRALVEKDGRSFQPLVVTLRRSGDDADASVRLGDAPGLPARLKAGEQTVELLAPAVSAEMKRTVFVEVKEKSAKASLSRDVTLKPVPKLTVYILPHSHTDIGYTAIQTDIEEKQVNNLVDRPGRRPTHRRAIPRAPGSSGTSRCSGRPTCYLHRLDDRQIAPIFSTPSSRARSP